MNHRTNKSFHPSLMVLESKETLSATAATVPVAALQANASETIPVQTTEHNVGVPAGQTAGRIQAKAKAHGMVSVDKVDPKPTHGYLIYRLTNPNPYNDHFKLPFGHVLVQTRKPIPGQIYNILQLTVRNGTAKDFDASSNFSVRFPGQTHSIPILTGDQVWKAGQNYIFYVMTKKYYPIDNQVTEGFVFNLGGARAIAIPGPSGIFLRVKYKPNTINKVLDAIVTKGIGAQGGRGIKYGIPDTAINEFLPAITDKRDFGGYF